MVGRIARPAEALNTVTQLVAYKQWATHLLHRALEKLPAFERERPRTIGFGSLLRTLHHQYAMDVVWRAHLRGEPHGYRTRDPQECPPFEALVTGQAELDAWYLAYAMAMLPAAADETVPFEFIGGAPGRMTRTEILLHVVNHATYHRGHIAQMLNDDGIPPPTTDLPVFLRIAGMREL